MDKPVFLSVEDTSICPQVMKLLETRFVVLKHGEFKTARNELVSAIYVRFARPITELFLAQFPNCEYVVCNATGLSHIDLEACQARDIEVISVKGEVELLKSVSATAEFTWFLMMSLARSAIPAIESVKIGEWTRDRFMGQQLKGKHIGIVGFGRNGKKIAQYATAFEMSFSVYDPHVVPDGGIETHAYLEALCNISDFVCITAVSNKETEKMFGVDILKAIKPGAFLINTARGEIVDEDAILDLLDAGSFAGYATDVVSNEEAHGSNPVVRASQTRDNIIVTPHIAGVTRESWEITERFVAEKLLRRIDEKP